MADTTITGLGAIIAGDFDDTAVIPVDDKAAVTKKATIAQLWTSLASVARTFAAGITATVGVFTSSTDASNATTAPLKTAGGLGVAKKGFFGDTVTAPTAHIGDAATNFAAFAADGELTLTGTARVTKHLVLGFAGIGLGATAPALTRLGNVIGYAFTVGDDGYFTTEVPPDWDSSTAVEVVLHNYTNATTGNIKFQATWSALPHGGTEAVDAPTHSGTLAPAQIAVPGTAKAFQEYSLGTIAAASLSDNDALFFLVSRVAKTSGSDPAQEPVLILIELLYTANKLGLAT